MVEKIRKRDGNVVPFEKEKIVGAVWKAAKSVGGYDKKRAKELADIIVDKINKDHGSKIPNVETVQDTVEKILVEEGHAKTAKAYILYRRTHQELRDVKAMFDTVKAVEDYVGEEDWEVKENSNMAFSLQGLNNYISDKIIKNYWLRRIYPEAIRKVHNSKELHIHDLGTLGPYCVGWDLKDLLLQGFRGVPGKVETKPPKHFRVALGQIINFFYTLQGEAAGAQAFSNFDTYLAPFVRYDNLDYKEVKQAMQEFCFNLAVPTRVGFQCMSEDTEILTPKGWASYEDLKKGDTIKTFNTEKGIVEDKPVRKLFKKKYTGKMWNLKNRIQDQLISPEHRVVRKKFQTNGYVLEKIEKVAKMKSPIIVPIAGKNIDNGVNMRDKKIELLAWIIGEGSIGKPTKNNRSSYRINIYQSAIKNKENYNRIKELLEDFKLNYSEYTQKGLGEEVQRIRLDAKSSKKIHSWFGVKEIDFIPENFLNMSERQSKIFLDAYMKAEGFENCKIATPNIDILNSLQAIASNAGYGSTVLKRKPTIGTKDIYVLRLIKHKDTYIQEIKKVDYSGIIWCPNTDNETVIARRNGKVFITGNTPFTNITMDLKVPEHMKDESVIVGGEMKDETYGDFEKEMKMINKSFAEVMSEGDANDRVFTFPIPTYNLTEKFDWENPEYDNIWEMTAKYGIPYFSNFINSDMSPEDARSMCCRLRIDNKELRKRGGGLFGSNPLTGSVGVVTINMPRLGFTSANEEEFFDKLSNLMELAKESLEIKRKALENFTNKGLYPYSKFYLRSVKKGFGKYWQNHFSTIGLLGMNEAIENFMPGENIATERGVDFANRTLDFMRDKLSEYQEETGNIYNLEATPGEGTTYKFATADKKRFGKIRVANEEAYQKGANPYYTNSTHIPVDYSDDLFKVLELQDSLQSKYTGGCIEKGNKVLTDKGLLPIEKIVNNFKKLKPIRALSYNGEKGISEWDKIQKAVSIDVKKDDKVRVEAERNLDITTSDWHPFFVLKKFRPDSSCPICKKKLKNIREFATHLRWSPGCRKKYEDFPKYEVIEKRADQLKSGDYILQNSTNIYPDKSSKLSQDLAWLIGFFIGDGCISEFVDNRGGNNLKKHSIRFFSDKKRALEKVAKILNTHFNAKVKIIKNDKRSEKLREVSTSKEEVVKFFLKYGFESGEKVYDVSIPKKVEKNLTKDNVMSLLSGLMDSDGHLSKRYKDFEYNTVSSNLANDILKVCSKAGILINKKKKKAKKKNESDIFRLRISQSEITKIKGNLRNAFNSHKIKDDLSNRKKRHLPVVRVKKISKVGVKDNKFYDLMTKKNHNYLAGKNTLVFIHNTVFHAFMGERLDKNAVKKLVKKIAQNFQIPYFTISPTFSICPAHGYIHGEHEYCPECEKISEGSEEADKIKDIVQYK